MVPERDRSEGTVTDSMDDRIDESEAAKDVEGAGDGEVAGAGAGAGGKEVTKGGGEVGECGGRELGSTVSGDGLVLR